MKTLFRTNSGTNVFVTVTSNIYRYLYIMRNSFFFQCLVRLRPEVISMVIYGSRSNKNSTLKVEADFILIICFIVRSDKEKKRMYFQKFSFSFKTLPIVVNFGFLD